MSTGPTEATPAEVIANLAACSNYLTTWLPTAEQAWVDAAAEYERQLLDLKTKLEAAQAQTVIDTKMIRDLNGKLNDAAARAAADSQTIRDLQAQVAALEEQLGQVDKWTGISWGACPANPGGDDAADLARVAAKWGAGVGGRQFLQGAINKGPYTVDGVERVHSSWNLSDSSVNAGNYDAAIDAMLLRAAASPYVHLVELDHEPNNDGLTSTGITARCRAKNRLYERKEALGLGDKVLVVATFTGGFWASYGTDAVRDQWLSQIKCDAYGLDADGVHTTTGPVYVTSYADEVKNLLRYQAKYGVPHVTVPEFGTSRQPWDTTGQPRAAWFSEQGAILATAKPLMVCAYDYNTSAHDTATNYNQLKAGTPEFVTFSDMAHA